MHLALVLGRPLALEGEPGVGKTELAKVLAGALGRELIRLQCYEGLDAGQALYEWDYPKQLLAVRVAEAEGREVGDLYDERFLLERPLLRTVRASEGAVLLIDEIDRSDSEFEAFLLEFLSDFQITIPEIGTLRAARPPVVVLTSNRTRELHDALKRRCLYHWIPFPDAERERAILRAQAPGLDDAAASALVEAIKRVRSEQLLKPPGIAETIDWAQGAQTLAAEGAPWPEALRRSLGAAAQGAGGPRAGAGARGAARSGELMPALARDHLHAFLRALEDAGVAVSSPKKADFLVAIVASPPEHVEALYWRARVTLLTRAEDFDAFDAVFAAFFRGGRVLVEEELGEPPEDEGQTAAPPGGDDADLGTLDARPGTGLDASPLDLVHVRSFAATPPESRDELRELSEALGTALPRITARRSARARRGPTLDVRRVLAAANRSGGEIVRLAWRRRPPRPRRVLVLIDVSGSLRAHSPDLLRFAHEVVRTTGRAEAFTFGTRLTRVTAELDTPDVDAALAALSACVLDADGGTRIGAALQQFLASGRSVAFARGALTIVLSDGLERGDPAEMAEAVARLGRLSHRLVWWSPLACDPAYRPVTRGMRAILPDLDVLGGARDLRTLLDEVRRLPETCARPRRTAARAWSAT